LAIFSLEENITIDGKHAIATRVTHVGGTRRAKVLTNTGTYPDVGRIDGGFSGIAG